MQTWFISDTHFGHKNILEYEKKARPFSDINEMNETIIDRWNSVVGKKDIVYHLGDVVFGKINLELLSRLKGQKRLVMGNHDTYSSDSYLKYFDKVYGCVFWERCILSHLPVHPNSFGSRWILNVHGHLHSRLVKINADDIMMDKRYFNVSCEQNYLTPIHRDIIMERIEYVEEINKEINNVD